jgi:multicomponent Na+:H+ antiporter subunit B
VSEYVLEACLLGLIVITAVAVVRLRNLFAASILLGIYSLLMALSWTNMQAYDVAFTEAAVGAGISTILVIGALIQIGGSKERDDRRGRGPHVPALITVTVVGLLIFYGTLDLKRIGDPTAPIHQGVAKYYVEQAYPDSHVPNVVTVILASYRGYDTMFETAVIFTAGAGLILLLRPQRPGTGRAGAIEITKAEDGTA